MYICVVKDYYYILGVNKAATLSEIQRAYQKLSLKFHPQNNGDDPFFAMHYGKIQEAYSVLSDDHKRFRYDKALGDELAVEVDRILDGPAPVVSSFFASKKAGQKGELLTISWEVLNADNIHINLIGDVASNGTQTIRLTTIAATEAYLDIELRASNNNSDKISAKTIQIKNLAYSSQAAALKKQQEASIAQEATVVNSMVSTTNKKKKTTKIKKRRKPIPKTATINGSSPRQQRGESMAYLLVALMFFFIVMMLYILHSINPMF